jgi:hypothetical protein
MIAVLGPVLHLWGYIWPGKQPGLMRRSLDETHPRHRIDRSTWRFAAQRATNAEFTLA